jgi:hypothetical protein
VCDLASIAQRDKKKRIEKPNQKKQIMRRNRTSVYYLKTFHPKTGKQTRTRHAKIPSRI